MSTAINFYIKFVNSMHRKKCKIQKRGAMYALSLQESEVTNP
ncbi:hypothetical protein H1P_2770007 [Hyella patelloides LEGE 07179]|uniref:Uncharacterized protein n=1 Tax=Hyella patelloides LEGE 07179 TaxID=945734 RepID=A0A563VTC5_9CYAN|nr:hypothetical protein H1P_2770007 [Hyella patelloides LEGE 07179]